MYGRWQSNIKMEIAKKLMSEMLDSLQKRENLELALRVYGHQKPFPPQDCDDTNLEVYFGPSKTKAPEIKEKIRSLKPSGTTPIALSLEKAADDFPYEPERKNIRNLIILITDGIEECKGDPCAVSLALQKKGIILKPFIIGLALEAELKKSFECIGTYFDASTEEQFKNVLNIVISQALNNTTAQVNLLDQYGNPTETNVGFTLYDEFSGAIKYNYVHTFNARGLPDTISLDPVPTYNLVVHTIPKVEKKGIKLTAGKHTIIAVDAPQGQLILKVSGNSDYKQLNYIIRKKGETQTLHVQPMNKLEKYLVGKYDIEVLTIPRLYINDVDISQNKTTTIQIPQPGILQVYAPSAGYGALYWEDDNQLKWQYNFEENMTRDMLLLQPGKYRIIWRQKISKSTYDTIEKEFKIESGSSVNIRLSN
jgi:Ca-activated chloride channel family protein